MRLRVLGGGGAWGPEAGLYLQLASGICASAMGLTAKLVGGMGVPTMQIVLARSLVVLVFATALVACTGRGGDAAPWPWRSPRRWLLLVRGVVGLGTITCYYSAVQLLPLADASAITFISPIFVALLSPLVLREGGGGRVVLCALPLSLVGVLLVARPTFLFGDGAEALSTLGVVVALMQAGFMASAKLIVRALGKSEPVGTIMLALAGVSVVGSLLGSAAVPSQALVPPPGAAAWGLLAAAGLLACGVQLMATTALKLSKATPTVAMSYLSVVWAMLWDLAIYHHKPSPLGLAGAAIVCSSSLVILLAEKQQAKAGGAPDAATAATTPAAAAPAAADTDPEAALQHPKLEAEDSSQDLVAHHMRAGPNPFSHEHSRQAAGQQPDATWRLRRAASSGLEMAAAGGRVQPLQERREHGRIHGIEQAEEQEQHDERTPLVQQHRPPTT